MLGLITQKVFFKLSGSILFAYVIGAIPFSSIISSKYGKNLIGSFSQPKLLAFL